MTCWTGTILMLGVIARCSLDFIGLEYGSENQYLTDNSLMYIIAIMSIVALITDIMNSLRSNYESRNK